MHKFDSFDTPLLAGRGVRDVRGDSGHLDL
jgi:hypothetical protein